MSFFLSLHLCFNEHRVIFFLLLTTFISEFKHHDLPELAPKSEQQVVYLSKLASALFDNTRFSYSGIFALFIYV